MYKDLGLKDQLKIVRNAIKNNKDPKQVIKNYDRSENGGYAQWYKEALPLGIDPNKYDIKQFYNDNPEDAWNIIQGKSNGELLQLYKTPQEIQKENQILQQRKRNTLNDLMDYTQYEKLINDYMNKSVNVSSCGGPVSINMYAEGTDNLNEKRTDITKFGTLESEYKDTRTPNFIDITPEELQNFINDSGRTITIDIPKDNLEGVPEEYKNLPKTRFIRIPYQFLKDRNYNVDNLKEDEAITYYLQDFNENDEYGNPREYYTIRKVNKHTPVGRAYDYWKRDQRLGNVLNSDWLYKDDKNIKEGPVDINNTVLLSDVTVTPENNKQFESDTAIPGEYNQQEKYIDPFNIGGTELNVPNNALYNTQGTKGGSSFGTSTDGLRMPDIFNMNMQDLYTDFQYTPYQWQQEDLEYLNPPGYVPIPNWDIAQVYDTGAEGADFANFMKMLAGYGRDNSLRNELMAKLFEPKDYFADPYAGSHYTDTQSFYDAYDNNPYNRIQRESNGIPLYAKGGLINK